MKHCWPYHCPSVSNQQTNTLNWKFKLQRNKSTLYKTSVLHLACYQYCNNEIRKNDTLVITLLELAFTEVHVNVGAVAVACVFGTFEWWVVLQNIITRVTACMSFQTKLVLLHWLSPSCVTSARRLSGETYDVSLFESIRCHHRFFTDLRL